MTRAIPALVLAFVLAAPSLTAQTDLSKQCTGTTRTNGRDSTRTRNYHDSIHVAVLYFDRGGAISTGEIPRNIDDNDAIVICVESGEDPGLLIEVEGKLSDASAYQVLGTGEVPRVFARNGGRPDYSYFGTFGPYAPPSVAIKISRRTATGTTLLRHYVIRINKTYLGAFRALAIASKLRMNGFTAGPAAGQTTPVIQNTANDDTETRYMLAFVPYVWRFWRAEEWTGRDVAKAPSLLDRLNPVFGVDIKNPTKEQFIGLSYEIFRGLDVMAGWHRAQVPVLAGGYKEGDPFSGDPETVPTRMSTQTEQAWGVSLDLRVAVQLMSSLFK